MRIDLQVPYSEKEEAKRVGAKWDIAKKKWYVENPEDLMLYKKWLKDKIPDNWNGNRYTKKTKKNKR